MKLKILLLCALFGGLLLQSCDQSETAKSDTMAATTAEDSSKILKDKQQYARLMTAVSSKASMEEMLTQSWVLENDVIVLEASSEPTGNMPFRSLFLSKDHHFVEQPRNEILMGTWKLLESEKNLELTYNNGKKLVHHVAGLGPQQLILTRQGEMPQESDKFISNGKQYIQLNDDPYSYENNLWRIRPSQKETAEQVRARLKQFIWFHILFYRDNLGNDEKRISFYGFPTCLKWYAGGIFMIKEKELSPNWFDCFYNKEQALEAYKMMESIIGKRYIWSRDKTVSWVAKNLSVLEQMYRKL